MNGTVKYFDIPCGITYLLLKFLYGLNSVSRNTFWFVNCQFVNCKPFLTKTSNLQSFEPLNCFENLGHLY